MPVSGSDTSIDTTTPGSPYYAGPGEEAIQAAAAVLTTHESPVHSAAADTAGAYKGSVEDVGNEQYYAEIGGKSSAALKAEHGLRQEVAVRNVKAQIAGAEAAGWARRNQGAAYVRPPEGDINANMKAQIKGIEAAESARSDQATFEAKVAADSRAAEVAARHGLVFDESTQKWAHAPKV